MEFELISEYAEDDYAFGAEDVDNECPTFEGDDSERCGICMDVVVDRGVLDCCQHWFCFTCIDNWASITNLCPLCQSEFQLITCVPVYDTIGSIQPDEDSYSRDDDWLVEGKNNTLSFPSYYIDENAVSCLEGDSCKIRGRSANVEEDPDLDTSIACDSCDLWYHAICVGFDPDGSCETSWLCPRCLSDETSPKSELGPSTNHGPESSSHEHLVDATFPRNVSVSLADAGETAVVVSIIDGNQQAKAPSKNMLSSVNMSEDLKIGNQGNEEMNQIMLPDIGIDKTSGDDNCKLEKQLSGKIFKKPKIEAVELDLSLSEETTCTLVSKSQRFSALSRSVKEETSETSVSDGLRTPEKLNDEHCNNKSLVSGFHLVSSVGPLSDKYETEEVEMKNVSRECRLPADKSPGKKEKAGGVTDAKRKQRDYSAEEGETKGKMQNSISTKLVKTDRRSRLSHSIDQANESVSDDARNLKSTVSGSGGSGVRKRKAVIDIKDIVQGPYRQPSKKDKETASGLRVKKIMRRANEDKESLVVVQNLRKEIREAIRNRSSKELGEKENLFDPKLLAAFRTALAGQTTETRRPPPLDLKSKKALLQKGTIRENLTKKIYGFGGKRKRAWTRDCEIEFWKHRCSKVSKPEKIETLKSVLDLLRKGPDVMEVKKENSVETSNSILSRLYIADASVFPRKDDIKPVSCAKSPEIIEASVGPTNSLVASKGTKKSEPATKKVNPNKSLGQSSESTASGSNPIKIDKKKWALEVLARKTAVSGNNASHGQDNAVLKGNYPLLAKLHVEMRPVLAPSQHNKIPISIRQAQLYRLTEHFLRKTNMPVTHPTAEIELAVADAINVEKAVADRSNSKLVYVNLCSQELLHRSDNTDSARATDSNSETATNGSEPTVTESGTRVSPPLNPGPSTDVDEALRNAGLLSDSPPNSPETEDAKEEDGPDNVFEMDAQPELDIYGDFEYDLEDDDFIGASSIKTSKLQQDESKIKMVFSTAWRFEDQEVPEVVENGNEDNVTGKTCQSSVVEGGEDEILGECEELYGPDKEPFVDKYPEIKPIELVPEKINAEANDDQGSNLIAKASEVPDGKCKENKNQESIKTKEKKSHADKKKQSDERSSVFKKVEAYIKEHVRPLCKSGVITVEQYRWAVGKTTDKIMKYHSKDTNANFLVKEGEKVKKLAEQYVESAQKVDSNKQKNFV